MGIRSRKRKTRSRTSADDPPSCSRRKDVDVHHLLPAPGEWRDWAALPHDVLWLILSRVPQADILLGLGAGLACSAWRRLAFHEPLFWRHIDLADDKDEPPERWQATARAAVDRSAGTCESFRGRVDAEFLHYLADSAPLLRSLDVTYRVGTARDDREKLVAAMKKLHLLERLVLSDGAIEVPSLVALLDHCPRLELLDAGGCHSFGPIPSTARDTLKRRIKVVRLPRRLVTLIMSFFPPRARDWQPHDHTTEEEEMC